MPVIPEQVQRAETRSRDEIERDRREALAEFDARAAGLQALRNTGATRDELDVGWREFNASYLRLLDLDLELEIKNFDDLWYAVRTSIRVGATAAGELHQRMRTRAKRLAELKRHVDCSGAKTFAESRQPVFEHLSTAMSEIQSRTHHLVGDSRDSWFATARLTTPTCPPRHGATRSRASRRPTISRRRRPANKSPGREPADPLPSSTAAPAGSVR